MSSKPVVPENRDERLKEAFAYADKWLGIIKQPSLSTETARALIDESKKNFVDHFNAGWIEYRKSVTEAGDWAAVEWSGNGAVFTDILQRKYIDCLGGYGLLNYGWSHPEIVDAVKDQIVRSPMPTQELIDPLRGVLARLVALITPGKIQCSFFCASGTEAIEGAIKLAKLYTGKSAFIVAVNGFHGKTMGSLSLIGKKDYRERMGRLYGGEVFHVPYGDADAVERQLAICDKVGVGVAGVIMEPIQGEAGAIEPPEDFWPRIRESTRKYGTLLIADEVQTGMGRTGKLFGVDHWNVEPDIMCLAKSFGGSVMPISCFCSTKEIWSVLESPNPFMHTTTTGGNPIGCAAAIAAIKVMLRDRLWEVAAEKGNYFKSKLQALKAKYPQIREVTGRGLLLALHFHDHDQGYVFAAQLFKRGVLVAGTLIGATSIRVEPPLVITYEQIDSVIASMDEALAVVASAVPAKL